MSTGLLLSQTVEDHLVFITKLGYSSIFYVTRWKFWNEVDSGISCMNFVGSWIVYSNTIPLHFNLKQTYSQIETKQVHNNNMSKNIYLCIFIQQNSLLSKITNVLIVKRLRDAWIMTAPFSPRK